MTSSTLTKKQLTVFGPHYYQEHGVSFRITAKVRYDDNCGNGHNSFAITGEIERKREGKNGWADDSCGCLHEEIVKHFSELAPLIKWHLCSSDGPMHYIDNTIYHATAISKDQGQHFVYLHNEEPKVRETLLGIYSTKDAERLRTQYGKDNLRWEPYHNALAKDANIDHARSSAIWPDATLEQLQSRQALEMRLPALLTEFRVAVESLGFTF